MLHSSFSAGEGIMRACMTHELMIKKRFHSVAHKLELLTPPITYWSDRRECKFFGKPKEITLDRESIDYKLIRMYLLSNDLILKILNDEFTKQYRHAAANGTMKIENWIPDQQTKLYLYNALKQHYVHGNNNSANNEFYSYSEFELNYLQSLLLGPPIQVKEYNRIEINNIKFRTHKYEGNKKTTHKYVYYRIASDIRDNRNKMRTKVAAQIDKIYQVYNTCILDDRITRAHTLLSVTNYLYVVNEVHASELPYVYEASTAKNTFTATPIISVDNVLPVNIALWKTENSQRFLVIQIDPVTNEYMPVGEED